MSFESRRADVRALDHPVRLSGAQRRIGEGLQEFRDPFFAGHSTLDLKWVLRVLHDASSLGSMMLLT